MTVTVFLLVALAASLHVLWNTLAKSSENKLCFAWLVSALGVALMGPIFLFCRVAAPGPLGGKVVAIAAGSGLLQATYFITLSLAYARADLSVVYPLSRGVAPLVTAAAAGRIVGDALDPLSGAAVAVVVVGVALVGAEALRGRGQWRRDACGILLALATGCLIGGYHLIDRFAMAMPDRPRPLEYLFVLYSFMTFFLAPWVWLTRAGRGGIARELTANRKAVVTGGICVPLAYFLIVTALRGGNVTYIAAARNIGILISTAVGALFLKEAVGWKRAAGAAMIAAGVAALVVVSSHS